MQTFAWNSDAGIGDLHFHGAIRASCAHFEHSALWHRVARVHEEIQEHLLQAVCGAENRRQIFLKFARNLYVRRFERMRNQRESFFEYGIEIHFAKLRGAGARKIQQVVDDLAGAESLLDDFFDERVARIVGWKLLRQHLNVI